MHEPYPKRHDITHEPSHYGSQLTHAEEYSISSRPRTPQQPLVMKTDQRTETLLIAGIPRGGVSAGHLQTEDPSYFDEEEYI
jgi:hypothetical protein